VKLAISCAVYTFRPFRTIGSAALYLWAGDLATHARIVGGASEPMARNGRNV